MLFIIPMGELNSLAYDELSLLSSWNPSKALYIITQYFVSLVFKKYTIDNSPGPALSIDTLDSFPSPNERHYSNHLPSLSLTLSEFSFSAGLFLLTYYYLSSQINKTPFFIPPNSSHPFLSFSTKLLERAFIFVFSHLPSHSFKSTPIRFSFPPYHHTCLNKSHQ